MLDNRSKYHFIPLLLISLLYIIAKNAKNVRSNNYSTILENYEYLRTLISFDLIFTIFGLISLVSLNFERIIITYFIIIK